MKKPNSSRWMIALCALAITSFTGSMSQAGLLDQIGSALAGRQSGHPESGDDLRHGRQPAFNPHPGPGSSALDDQNRRRGGGGGGHDDGPGHH